VSWTGGTVVFRENCYPYSETFIWEQAARLPGSNVVGYRRVHDLPPLTTDVVLGDRHPRRAVVEARLLKLSRRSVWLHAVLLAHRPKAILAHSTYEAWSLLPSARQLKIPVVVAIHGSDVTRRPEAVSRDHYSLRQVNRHFGEFASQVALFLPASRFLAQALRDRGVSSEKVRIHHVGIPIPAAAAPEVRHRRITYVGRIAPSKGVGVLLDAFSRAAAQDPDVRLTIVGDGPLAPSLRDQAARSGVASRVEFTGQRPPGQVRSIMRDSLLVVVPSEVGADGVQEGLGQVSLEAQSHGVPVLVTAVGGLPETLPPEQGAVSPPGDVQALSRAMHQLLTQPKMRCAMGLAGRSWVSREFDIDRQTVELQELLQAVT